MDAMSRLRLLAGPVRPFIFTKLRDALAKRGRRARARRLLSQNRQVTFTPMGLTVHPDAESTAARRADGFFDGYGVDRWDPTSMSLVADSPDPRAVLELARMHQWTAYAAASRDGDDRWFGQFTSEVEAFKKHHPAMDGPLWRVAMDSGIRVYNMLLAVDVFQQHGFSDDRLTSLIADMAAEHGIAIEGGLETSGGMATSHLLGNLLGLIAVSQYTDWVGGFSAAEMMRSEAEKQILPDGMSFEASTGYHTQVVDILVHAQRLLGEEWPATRRAVEAQKALINAQIPLIGDNDDGLVVKPAPDVQPSRPEAPYTKQFPDFGLWIWSRDRYTLSARNGPAGQYGKGGHAHDDQNSITLRVDGQLIITDPGCSVYTADPDQRNAERSSASHATVNLQQGWAPPNSNEGLFWLLHDELGRRVSIPSEHEWAGTVQAYMSPSDSHTRSIRVGETIEVSDSVTALPVDRRITIPLGPGCAIETNSKAAQITCGETRVEISWNNATPEVHDCFVSERYAELTKSKVLTLKMNQPSVDWSILILTQ